MDDGAATTSEKRDMGTPLVRTAENQNCVL